MDAGIWLSGGPTSGCRDLAIGGWDPGAWGARSGSLDLTAGGLDPSDRGAGSASLGSGRRALGSRHLGARMWGLSRGLFWTMNPAARHGTRGRQMWTSNGDVKRVVDVPWTSRRVCPMGRGWGGVLLAVACLRPLNTDDLRSVDTHIHTHRHTHIHTHMHTYTHTYIHTYIHTYTHAYIHT